MLMLFSCVVVWLAYRQVFSEDVRLRTEFSARLFFKPLLCQLDFFPWKIRVAFPEESQLRQSRATQPEINTSLVYAVFFVCDYTTGCDACSFTTDGYGIFNKFGWALYTRRGVRHTHVCTSVYSEGQKNCRSPCPARGSNPGSLDFKSDALTTELRSPSLSISLTRYGWRKLDREGAFFQRHLATDI